MFGETSRLLKVVAGEGVCFSLAVAMASGAVALASWLHEVEGCISTSAERVQVEGRVGQGLGWALPCLPGSARVKKTTTPGGTKYSVPPPCSTAPRASPLIPARSRMAGDSLGPGSMEMLIGPPPSLSALPRPHYQIFSQSPRTTPLLPLGLHIRFPPLNTMYRPRT